MMITSLVVDQPPQQRALGGAIVFGLDADWRCTEAWLDEAPADEPRSPAATAFRAVLRKFFIA